MAARRMNYSVVGRYMDGPKVTGYQMLDLETGKTARYTREQTIFLVGRGQVDNVEGQLYKQDVILRGIGIDMSSLPVQNERTGELSRAESVGKIRKGTEAGAAMSQVLISRILVNGNRNVGYVLRSPAGTAEKAVDREVLLDLVQKGRVGNARVQMFNGKRLLRGVGCDLSHLPKEEVAWG